MRYDDYDDYSSRSSRGNSRRGSSSYSSGRDYDRDYYRDRDYRSDFGRDYDRGYYDRDRYSDRYSTRSSRDWYDDFDRSDWERTAPNWEDHGAARKKRPAGGSTRSSRPAPSGRSGSRSGSSSSRNTSRSGQGSRNGNRRPPEDPRRRPSSQSQRRPPASSSRRSAVQLVPIILGLVVIVLAALVIRSMLGGKSGYELEFSTKNIVVGETATATLKGVDSNAAEPEVLWTSSENNVVSVEGDGLECTLTAKSLGSATIIATVEGEKVASGTVTVVDTAPGVVSIRVSQDEVTISSGETYTINATVEMEKADMTPATIKWSSNNTSVAEVDSEGVITAREVGNAIIKGVAGEKTVEIAVEVVENPNSTPHDSTQDAGREPEEGQDATNNNNNSNNNSNSNNSSSNQNRRHGGWKPDQRRHREYHHRRDGRHSRWRRHRRPGNRRHRRRDRTISHAERGQVQPDLSTFCKGADKQEGTR